MDAAWSDSSRILAAKLEVQWDGTNWTDETSYLMDAGGSLNVPPVWRQLTGIAVFKYGRATFSVRSPSNRFSPHNTGSPIYTYIKDNAGYGIPLRFSVAVKDNAGAWQWERVFTGYIDRLSLTSLKYNRMKIQAVDGSHPYLQDKRSTAVLQNYTAGGWIAYLAALVGISSTDLDAGSTKIPYCWLDNENVLNEMAAAAHAEGGVVFFDRNGVLKFYGAESFVKRTELNTAQHGFTVSNMREANARWDWESVYNSVIIPYAPRAAGASATLYTLAHPFSLNAGESKTITAKHKFPALSVDDAITTTILSAAGDDLSASVSVSKTSTAQRSVLTFTNNHSYHTANVLAVSLTGVPLLGNKSEQIERSSVSAVVGEPSVTKKSLPAANNAYLQSAAQSEPLAAMLIDRLIDLRGAYTITAPMLPALEPYQRITITDADSGLSREAYLTGVRWRFNKGVFDGDYEAIDAAGWYPNLDTPGYFEIGVDKISGGKVVFY